MFSLIDFVRDVSLLDLCAAPGSKTLQASEYFAVTANELDPSRFKILQKRCCNQPIELVNMDAFKLLDEVQPNQFQVMLLDPTCSSSGRKNEDRRLAEQMGAPKETACLKQLVDF